MDVDDFPLGQPRVGSDEGKVGPEFPAVAHGDLEHPPRRFPRFRFRLQDRFQARAEGPAGNHPRIVADQQGGEGGDHIHDAGDLPLPDAAGRGGDEAV